MKWRDYRSADLLLVSGAAVDPITIDEIKDQVIVEHTTDDSYISTLIPGLVKRVEEAECWIQLITAQWDMKFDVFPEYEDDVIRIPKPPIQSVDSITYVDADGATQTWDSSNYVVHPKSPERPERAEVSLAYQETWPIPRAIRDAITIRFTCGFGDDATDVPRDIRRWMLMMAATEYRHREMVTDRLMYGLDFVDGLLDPYRAREHVG